MSLPPIQTDSWDHENIHDQLHYYETDEVLEYGRQCWNAAIEAAEMRCMDEHAHLGELKITLNTVSPSE